ncbi:hypothetical protein APED_19215 [Acanthopleuribacter pedis]
MAKPKKKRKKSGPAHRPQVHLTEEQYHERLLTLLEAREAHYDGHNNYFDLGGGQRHQIVKDEFDLVARREGIPVMVHPVKGKPTLAFVFPPAERPPAEVIVCSGDGTIKHRIAPPEKSMKTPPAEADSETSDLAIPET